MYIKKRLVCTDKSGRAVATLTISGEDGNARIKLSPTVGVDEVLLCAKTGQQTYKIPPDGVFTYPIEGVRCALLYKENVVASSSATTWCSNDRLVQSVRDYYKPNTTLKSTIVKKETDIDAPSIDTHEDAPPLSTPFEEELKEETKTNEDDSVAHFYCSIKRTLDETFTCYPEVKRLMDLIPYSKWVEVRRDDNPYVVGLINDEERPLYVCYGVKGIEGHEPPDDIKKYCQWLPIDGYDGYWIIFQDAVTGETISHED